MKQIANFEAVDKDGTRYKIVATRRDIVCESAEQPKTTTVLGLIHLRTDSGEHVVRREKGKYTVIFRDGQIDVTGDATDAL